MAVINTGLLATALRGEFFTRFAGTPTFYQQLTTRIPSTGPLETYKFLGTVPNMRLFGNGRLAKGLRTESYSVENQKYEATVEVDRDEISDDQLGQIRIRILELAPRAATHKDYLIAQLLINGGTAGFNSYDGKTFFSDSHESGNSGVQDNNLTSVAAADDAVPTTVEFKAAYQAAISALLSFKDDQGEPMSIDESGLIVMVPPRLRSAAREALNAQVVVATTNVEAGGAQVIVNPWLPNGTTTQTWYLLKNNVGVRPFVFQDREPITFDAIETKSEEEFKREKYLYGVRARYAMTYGYWQYAVRHVFTT